MIINVHAGHNPDGKIGCGAVGIGYESTMNRQVCHQLIAMLREAGHTVYDCTVDDGQNAADVLHKIVEKCNAHDVDIDISIHHNASTTKDFDGDGKTMGTGCYIYPNSKMKQVANKIMVALSTLGFRQWGVYESANLYVLRNTKAPAVLVECCFVDDADDMNLWNDCEIAAAIMRAVTGDIVDLDPETPRQGSWYKVQTGAFRSKLNAMEQLDALKREGYTDAFIQEYRPDDPIVF